MFYLLAHAFVHPLWRYGRCALMPWLCVMLPCWGEKRVVFFYHPSAVSSAHPLIGSQCTHLLCVRFFAFVIGTNQKPLSLWLGGTVFSVCLTIGNESGRGWIINIPGGILPALSYRLQFTLRSVSSRLLYIYRVSVNRGFWHW